MNRWLTIITAVLLMLLFLCSCHEGHSRPKPLTVRQRQMVVQEQIKAGAMTGGPRRLEIRTQP